MSHVTFLFFFIDVRNGKHRDMNNNLLMRQDNGQIVGLSYSSMSVPNVDFSRNTCNQTYAYPATSLI